MPRTGSGWLDGSHDEDSDDELLNQMGATYRREHGSNGGKKGGICGLIAIAGVASLALTAAAGVRAYAATDAVYHVPPITCESLQACQVSYVGPSGGRQGYWMARRFDRPGLWVRLTRVAGWDNTYAAPITCATEDSCVLDYYEPTHGELGPYWMARQMDGTKWVRLTLIPGVAA